MIRGNYTIAAWRLLVIAASASMPGHAARLRDALPYATAVAARSTQPAERGWAVTPDATVRLYVPAGRLSVRTWARDSVHLRGALHANASLFGGGARTHVKLGVEARSSSDGTLPQATLEVYVPRRARLWVKMIDGTMTVTGTREELEAYTVRGQVDVSDAHGSTTVESIDAPVTLSQITGDVRVRGSRAAVRLDRVQALASIATVSGDVTLQGSAIEGRVETVGGAITTDGVRQGGVLTLQSHAGDITITLPPAANPRLTLRARDGDVRGSAAGHTREGTIEARTFKGRVQVLRPR